MAGPLDPSTQHEYTNESYGQKKIMISKRNGDAGKSCHSDQILTGLADFPLSVTPINFETPRVHSGVHRPRVADGFINTGRQRQL
jgi:hypothetical protein